MTTPIQPSAGSKKSYRSAGWMATTSGVAGVTSVIFLIAYLALRSSNSDYWRTMNIFHDIAAIVQLIFLIPIVNTFYKRPQEKSSGMSKFMFILGTTALLSSVLFLLLGTTKIFADVLYMFPQGIFGIWLMFFCLRYGDKFGKGLKWFGVIVGFGLALVGMFPLEYALFVDPIILSIPAAPPEEVEKIPINQANMMVHQILFIGTPLGVLTLPFWTIWLGRWLRKQEN